jgi:hypothetical protein
MSNRLILNHKCSVNLVIELIIIVPDFLFSKSPAVVVFSIIFFLCGFTLQLLIANLLKTTVRTCVRYLIHLHDACHIRYKFIMAVRAAIAELKFLLGAPRNSSNADLHVFDF